MSDAELSDIVAYVRSVPAVEAEVPAPRLGPVGKVLIAVGKFPLSAERQAAHAEPHPAQPPATADSVQFGEHLDFERALTLGVSKDGRALRAPMTEVVSGTKSMLPTERKALPLTLQSSCCVCASSAPG